VPCPPEIECRLRYPDEPLVSASQCLLGSFPTSPRRIHHLPSQLLRAPATIPKQPPWHLRQLDLGSAKQPSKHPHAVGQQRRVGGVVYVRLHYRAVRAHLPAPCDAQGASEHHHAIAHPLEGVGSYESRPADKRGVVGGALQAQSAKLPEYERVADVAFGLLVAEVLEAPEHQHPQHHLHRRGAAPKP
jgi:hypothetical protein